MNVKEPKYYRARIEYILNEMSFAIDDKEKRLLANGFIKDVKHFEGNIKAYEKDVTNEPLSFAEITSFSTWFAMHPEKMAGIETESTSKSFPVKLKGNRTDIDKMINKALQSNTSESEAEAEALALALQIELELMELNGLSGMQFSKKTENIFNYILNNAVEVPKTPFSYSLFKKTIKNTVTPKGVINMSKSEIDKLQKKINEIKNRKRYFSFIKPTLSEPTIIIEDNNRLLFIKAFIGLDGRLFIAVLSKSEKLKVITLAPKRYNNIKQKIESGNIVYPEHFLSGIGSPTTEGAKPLRTLQLQKADFKQYTIVEINLPFDLTAKVKQKK